MRNSTDDKPISWDKTKSDSKMADCTSTMPRRLSVENSPLRYQNKISEDKNEDLKAKSFLPVKFSNRDNDVGTSHVSRRLRSPTHNDSPTSEKLDGYLNKKDSDTSRLCKYLSPTKYYENLPRPYTPVTETKSELYPATTARKSRFLRPDFYENKDGNYFLKEKKEREIETQKVLREIRDRRRSRVREQSLSKDPNKLEVNGSLSEEKGESDKSTSESTDNILQNVSDNIKNLESNVKNLHNYVNVRVEDKIPEYVNVTNTETPVIKKTNASKIARPKSYPTETQEHKKLISKIPEMASAKTKSIKAKKSEKDKDGEKSKNKFLQSIEKKFEKLRSFSNSPTTSVSSEEAKARDDKKSSVEDTIKRLREQSLPRTVDNCITESGLIKRAVSVEDLSSSDPKQLQASRKSVTKILNLFKKYEDKGNKTKDKSTKSKKTKDDAKKPKDETKKGKIKLEVEKTDKNNKAAVAVISNNVDKSSKNNSKLNCETASKCIPSIVLEQGSCKKPERPNSLLLDNVKFNAQGEGSASVNKDTTKLRTSKLPVTSFRRSLNLENAHVDSNKYGKNDVGSEAVPSHNNLTLDLQLPANLEPCSSSPHDKSTNRNSFATTDDSSLLLSPYEDNLSCDSWSVCSDYNTQELTSPISPCSNFYSADENESVSDRIRRKSFYTRFNEKKRPRKTSLNSYRDLDLYKDMNSRKSNYRNDCNYLDRKSAEPEASKEKYYANYEPLTYKRYGQNNSENFSEYNELFPDKYQTYNPRMYRRSASVYASDTEEPNTLDESSATGKHKMYSYYNRPSRFSNRSVSPVSGHGPVESSVNQNIVHSSTSQNHV